ncbi:hypothetical protein M3Y99_01379000 [Aphelenchoides fujianensis]|nr:hypothetical protein M3Y99_01379000 [Aphelenchoides fujianensis]
MSTTSDSSQEEAGGSKSPAIAPQRPAPPTPRVKIPPPPEDDLPPPYEKAAYPSRHAQSSSLLAGSRPTERPTSQPPPPTATSNRNPNVANAGIRKYTRHLTKRNLLIALFALIFLVVLITLLAYFLGGDDEYYVPPGDSESSSHPSDRNSVPMKMEWRLLGAFKEMEQRMSFDETSDAVILSKYFPEEHVLKAEKLVVSNHREGFTYSTHNVSAIYAECSRFTDDVICCSTSAHSHSHKTDCFLNVGDEVIHSVATHYDFMQNGWQSLADDEKLLLIFNRQRHAVLNLRTKRIHSIEENRLPQSYRSVAFFFPMDNAVELDELVRSGDEFKICEYKQTNTNDYALQAPECRTTPFHVEYELPKVKFCSNPMYTAVVQYGHLADGQDITFRVKIIFNGKNEVYSSQESLQTPYEQLVMDCNDETLEIYVMGEAEIAAFSLQLPDLRTERFIQTRL